MKPRNRLALRRVAERERRDLFAANGVFCYWTETGHKRKHYPPEWNKHFLHAKYKDKWK
jgi:hypothetical protein